jgi:hypothetical protein
VSVSPAYPAQLEFDADLRIARWRPLVHWLLAVPQFLVAKVLGALRGVLTLISFFTVLFTKRIPPALFDMMVMTHRYRWRAVSYALFMHEDYPPFDFASTAVDNGVEPHTQLSIIYTEEMRRWAPLYKWILAIPHYVVLVALALVGVVTVVISFFAVLFTGSFPKGLRDYIVGVARWGLRVEAYVGLLTDEYPPFRLGP